MLRAFQWDLARQVERLDVLIGLLPRYADWGYHELYLHLEDAIHYPSLPGVGRPDAYTYAQFERLVAAADRAGLKVVPIVNLLGHTQYLIKTDAWRDLNELRHPDGSPQARGQICPLHPRLPEVAAKLLHDVAPFCTAGKVHLGLDESFHLGKHPASRDEIARVGLPAHFASHVRRLHALAGDLGLRAGLWADMLALLPEAIPLLPSGLIAYDWYYYPFKRHPRVELYNFSEYDLSVPLRAQGLDYWGCPMNGAFRYEPLPVFGERLANIESWWRRCHRTEAEGFLVTSWETYRLAFEMTGVVDAATACLWLDPTLRTPEARLKKGFERLFGRTDAGRATAACRQSDVYPFSGYAKWEIDSRWDTQAFPDAAKLARTATTEARHFARLARQRGLPAPLAASLGFRAYLAERDRFVRASAHAVLELRRLLTAGRKAAFAAVLQREQAAAEAFATAWQAGRQAAQTMWRRTRRPSDTNQNEHSLQGDRRRLRAWCVWLRRCGRRPSFVHRASPLAGAWQLQFMVYNFAPALQKVIVEERQPDGSWRELHSRFTIEFLAAAAQPRAQIARGFAAPVSGPQNELRLAVRGLGQVAIGQVELTDGVQCLRPRRWPAKTKRRLGEKAPRAGLPDLDWQRYAGPPLPLEWADK